MQVPFLHLYMHFPTDLQNHTKYGRKTAKGSMEFISPLTRVEDSPWTEDRRRLGQLIMKEVRTIPHSASPPFQTLGPGCA
jgi:hypothetical protein